MKLPTDQNSHKRGTHLLEIGRGDAGEVEATRPGASGEQEHGGDPGGQHHGSREHHRRDGSEQNSAQCEIWHRDLSITTLALIPSSQILAHLISMRNFVQPPYIISIFNKVRKFLSVSKYDLDFFKFKFTTSCFYFHIFNTIISSSIFNTKLYF